jgi:precorrin-6B methylase 2
MHESSLLSTEAAHIIKTHDSDVICFGKLHTDKALLTQCWASLKQKTVADARIHAFINCTFFR